ncbi:class D sortase [Bacillus swezeyi]|uniref:Class D sortase n=1 Tax=Bacillus swezeyi TaxID=1925020 RepID=A0A5M8RXP9_9BACI|nr:class D sortase [Bacillus swezeyi]KAA6452073.1 class D sortase [Bacillus swezeyi]TYS37781.1 class D sortase [Bacillus swezeyi]
MAAAGLYFTTTNVFKLLHGYTLFSFQQVKEEKTTEKPPVQTAKKEKAAIDQTFETGEKIGDLVIPKINARLPIYHGTDEDELQKGVGHFAGSVLPGEDDNSVLSGHRDTVFRKLGEVGKGDRLIVEAVYGTFTYKVKKVRIVDADDRTVIVPKPRAMLTVSTCYPFDFIGSAPERYVLVADLIKG